MLDISKSAIFVLFRSKAVKILNVWQSCLNLNLITGVTALFVCLRRDLPEVVLITARVAKDSYSFPA
jgi:hypothetical protein